MNAKLEKDEVNFLFDVRSVFYDRLRRPDFSSIDLLLYLMTTGHSESP